MGNNSDPLSLHKYLYGGSDPVNHVDPSGHFFSLSSVSAAQTIQAELTTFQIDTGLNLLDLAIDPGSAGENFAQNSGIALGLGVLGGSSFKLLKMLSGKFRQACNSFEGDTGVWTEDGVRDISNLLIGDRVWAFNEETQQLELQDIVHLIQREGEYDLFSITLESGEVINTTKNHPFYVKTDNGWEWIDAGDLQLENMLRDKSGNQQVVAAIDVMLFQGKVYNLTVDNHHTYLVGGTGVVAHNAGACKIPIFNTRKTNHIRGEFNSGGAFVGYHSRFGGSDRSGVRVLNIVRPAGGNRNKIYGGTVQVLKDGVWVNKRGGFSTFWPDGWNLQRIQAEVNAVYNTAVTRGFSGSGTFTRKGPSGFDVLVQAEGGVIVRTHPVF